MEREYSMRSFLRNFHLEIDNDEEVETDQSFNEENFVEIVNLIYHTSSFDGKFQILLENIEFLKQRQPNEFPNIDGIDVFHKSVLDCIYSNRETYEMLDLFLHLYVLNNNSPIEGFVENNIIEYLFSILESPDITCVSISLTILRSLSKRSPQILENILSLVNFDLLAHLSSSFDLTYDIHCFILTVSNQKVPAEFKKESIIFSMNALQRLYEQNPDELQYSDESSIILSTIILNIQDVPEMINNSCNIYPFLNLVLEKYSDNENLVYRVLLYLSILVKKFKFNSNFVEERANLDSLDNFNKISFEEIPRIMCMQKNDTKILYICINVLISLFNRNVTTRISDQTFLHKVIPYLIQISENGRIELRIIAFKALKSILTSSNHIYRGFLMDKISLQSVLEVLETNNTNLLKKVLEFIYEYCTCLDEIGILEKAKEVLDTPEIHEQFDELFENPEVSDYAEMIIDLCFPED
ncbi:hypothetical protein TVAG_194690 [Trichomonas vaginalis G3]|uniref:Uncharacterized protein n=1 Tax=Trichomonas vaginalis (strain ATCC PRA-98 / G3) TaxID=412133 RepID=A2FL12_TRIV3|nr:hypothetical protein TVAG_194690 [Trichomonas vaginalis G3]|eukprot:XP_001307313.1 hypothetical protein [Trichomonas vaginalis G3]